MRCLRSRLAAARAKLLVALIGLDEANAVGSEMLGGWRHQVPLTIQGQELRALKLPTRQTPRLGPRKRATRGVDLAHLLVGQRGLRFSRFCLGHDRRAATVVAVMRPKRCVARKGSPIQIRAQVMRRLLTGDRHELRILLDTNARTLGAVVHQETAVLQHAVL
jgi:hypothetical protein